MRLTLSLIFILIGISSYSQDKEEDAPYQYIVIGEFPTDSIPKKFSKKVLTMKKVQIYSSESDGRTEFRTKKFYDGEEEEMWESMEQLRKHGFKKMKLVTMDTLFPKK